MLDQSSSKKLVSGSGVPDLTQDSREGRIKMLENTEVADAIKTLLCETAETYVSPSVDSFEMDSLKDNVQDWRDVIFPALNSLPECPEIKALKRDINAFIGSLWSRKRDFAIASLEFMRLQTLATEYIIVVKKIRPTRGVKPVQNEGDDLKEIEPTNEREARAMVLFRSLKLHPTQAIDTAKARTFLEAAEGKQIGKEQALRAMKLLPELYSKIVFEQVGNKTRIKFKTLPNQSTEGVTV